MSVNACAEIVRRGDPDRFLAVMAAPPAARGVLFPLYAFNVEVARAPWVTAEPLIAEMRLQWWRDALDEIATGGIVRRHEVVVPLAHVLDAGAATQLQAVVDARRHDIDRQPFADIDALTGYLTDTGGRLMAVAAQALGAAGDAPATAIGTAGALANYLLAVPALIAAGRQPIDEGWIVPLCDRHLVALQAAKGGSRSLRGAALSVWRARGILRVARRDPAAVAAGRLGGSEFGRRAGLLKAQVFGI